MIDLLLNIDVTIKTLALFVCLDFITGIIYAIRTNSLNSTVCYNGITKKSLIIIILICAIQLDIMMGSDHACRNIVTYFYICNEGMSILENAGRLGVPIPEKIKTILEKLKETE